MAAWRTTIERTVAEFREDNVTDWAAALTYYAVLSIFPALIALVAVVGLIGESITTPLLTNLGSFSPGPVRQILENALNGLARNRGGAGALFVVGLAGAFWAASGYVGAFIRASNVIWDVEEGRSVWKTVPLRVAITIVVLVLLAVTVLAVAVTGPAAREVGRFLGVGDTAVSVWEVAKWPMLVLAVSLMFSILFYLAPNVRQPGFHLITAGGVLAVTTWILVSALFGAFVANFGSYDRTYGSLAAMVVFLVWLWLTNIAILLGAELNAEIERGKQIEAGHPPEREPFLRPRAEPKR
jgi:membrane protein